MPEGWVLGFSKGFLCSTNNQMELLALSEGLKLVEKHQLLPVEININSQEVINMLHLGNLHYNAIINDCSSRLRRIGNPIVARCFREQNGVVDALAKMGVGSSVQMETGLFVVPPMYAQQLLWADIIGTYFVRRIGNHTNYFEGDVPTSFVLNPD